MMKKGKGEDIPWAESKPGNPTMVMLYHHSEKQVEEMDFETYLLGVVAAEMPVSYEMEALKAQAVAARTYALMKMESGGCGREGAHVCTDYAHCQAYNTLAERQKKWGKSFDENEGRLKEAVESTAGEVLTYEGKPIAAFFHAIAGGQTEDVQNVWGGNLPYLKSVESMGEEEATRYNRTVAYTYKEYTDILKAVNKNVAISDVQKSIGAIQRTDSGRVDTIALGGVSFKGTEIRTLFSLDSANFTISATDGKVYFTTLGYGHGVGMSQVGANAMAKDGKNYQEILLHYYSGVSLEKMQNILP
ncbi:stage II sporulation protein D [Eubacteriales bacterium OttesenSCG-928-M02]|nr:stage II sporulation protein D [Eubacteriales bacterium OttesenSCG-928-M02]